MVLYGSDNPILSVVVPIYSETENLENLRSWLSSSQLSDLQVVLVIDSPRDRFSKEVLELGSYANNPSIEIHHAKFGSPGQTRNLGIDLATGEWIAFWDCDDLPLVDEFKKMIQVASATGANACLGSYEVLGSENNQNVVSEVKVTPTRNFYVQLAINPGLWRFAFKRSSIRGIYFPAFRMGEDQAFLAHALSNQEIPHRHKEVVYKYIFGNPSQLTKNDLAVSELTESLVNLRVLRNSGVQNKIVIPMFLIQSRSLAMRSSKSNQFKIAFSALRFMTYRVDILTLLFLHFLREKYLHGARRSK